MSFDPERQPEDFGDARADPRLRASPTPRRSVKLTQSSPKEKTFRSRPPEGLFASAAAAASAPAARHPRSAPPPAPAGIRRILSLSSLLSLNLSV